MPSAEPVDALNSIKIQNCVATVNLGCDLNLRRINFQTRNSEYNPSRFHGVIMRIREPRCTALIFRSGKLVCTGARNEIDANLGTRKFARILQKLGYPVNTLMQDSVLNKNTNNFSSTPVENVNLILPYGQSI